MNPSAIALVLLSALLHAVWNLFSKDASDKWGFYVAQGVCAMIGYAGFIVWFWPASMDASGLWLAILSVVIHAGYAIYLLKAYEAGDLSVAYPLSRTAPILVAAWESLVSPTGLTRSGVAGTVIAGLGATVLQIPALRMHGWRKVLGAPVTRYALLSAVCIAGFSIVDKAGVAHMPPFLFLYVIIVGEAGVIAVRLGRQAPARGWRQFRQSPRPILFTSMAGPLSYLLILAALRSAPASYVLGLRQTSIVFGVIFGRLFLGEGDTAYRLAGAAIIVSGVLMIAIGG